MKVIIDGIEYVPKVDEKPQTRQPTSEDVPLDVLAFQWMKHQKEISGLLFSDDDKIRRMKEHYPELHSVFQNDPEKWRAVVSRGKDLFPVMVKNLLKNGVTCE